MDPISGAASIITIAALSAEITQTCRKYLKDYRDAPIVLARFCNEIEALTVFFDRFLTLQCTSHDVSSCRSSVLTEVLQRAPLLTDYESQLRKLDVKIKKLDLRRVGRRFLFPLHERQIQEGLEVVQKIKGMLESALRLDDSSNTQSIHNEVLKIGAALKNQDQMLIDVARREAVAILRTQFSNARLVTSSDFERSSQGEGLDYSYLQSRKPSERTLATKIHDLSFGRISVYTENSTESSKPHGTNWKAKRSRVAVDFVPSSAFWQTIIQLRLEWAARLDSLTAPTFSLQFLNIVQDDHPIIRASIRGDSRKLEDLVSDQGVSPFCSTTAGWTPLHYAAAYGQTDICRLLMAQGAPLGATGVRGITPLHLAAHFGRFEIFKALTKAGSDPDEYHEHGLNAIFEILSNEAVSNSPDLATFLTWLFHGQEQFVLDTEAKDNSKRGILYHLAYPPGSNSQSLEPLPTFQSKTIGLVLSKGARADEIDIHGTSVLHAACRDGRLDLVERLVPGIHNINSKDRRGCTPLQCAVRSGNFELVSILVRAGSDINAFAYDEDDEDWYEFWREDRTPLSLAAAQGWVDMVEYLLQHGAGYRDKDVLAAFRLAVLCSEVKTVQYFIENEIHRLNISGIANGARSSAMIEVLCKAGADIDAEDSYGWTRLGSAARWAWGDVAKKLVELGADIDKLTHGLTPLGHAAKGGHGDIVRLLLTAGAQTELTGDQMPTPLQLATSSGYDKVADNIARHTLSSFTGLIDTLQVDIVEQETDVAEAPPGLDWNLEAAIENGDPDVVEKLIEKNCTLKAGKGSWMSPLYWAIINKQLAVASRLVQAGADVNECDDYGRARSTSPILAAVLLKNAALIELMIRHGADVNFSDDEGSTPLLQSLDLQDSYLDLTSEGRYRKACYSNAEVVRVLLSAGANVDAIDDFGRTPLGKAAAVGNFDAVVALVEAGADLNRPSSQNEDQPMRHSTKLVYRTPLAWAALMGHEDVVRFLFEAGAEWRSLKKEPALSYTHRLLMESWFPDDTEAPSDSVPCVELLSVFPEDATENDRSQSFKHISSETTPFPVNGSGYGANTNRHRLEKVQTTTVMLIRSLSVWVQRIHDMLQAIRIEVVAFTCISLLLLARESLRRFSIPRLSSVKLAILAMLTGMFLASWTNRSASPLGS